MWMLDKWHIFGWNFNNKVYASWILDEEQSLGWQSSTSDKGKIIFFNKCSLLANVLGKMGFTGFEGESQTETLTWTFRKWLAINVTSVSSHPSTWVFRSFSKYLRVLTQHPTLLLTTFTEIVHLHGTLCPPLEEIPPREPFASVASAQGSACSWERSVELNWTLAKASVKSRIHPPKEANSYRRSTLSPRPPESRQCHFLKQ